ncbi:Histone H1 [Thiomonas sp. X19]|uniref:histone H1 n=1 Tax=Thiomonas sp. X19 TaxID=1050370 RepID=UPI000B71F598|nr:histone H1 [Thiomonas sp. X19]SCC91310.1 Histone H1 [Thiomonas sp. X19]
MKARSTKKLDLNQLAKAIVDEATGEIPKVIMATPKQRAGQAGGLKGGKSRMSALTPDERKALAMKGVAARQKAPAPAGAVEVKK